MKSEKEQILHANLRNGGIWLKSGALNAPVIIFLMPGGSYKRIVDAVLGKMNILRIIHFSAVPYQDLKTLQWEVMALSSEWYIGKESVSCFADLRLSITISLSLAALFILDEFRCLCVPI